jgi:hypothetical protein
MEVIFRVVKRLLPAICCAALLSGCGGSSSEGSAQDEAGVAFKRPMLLSAVLDLAHRHHVQPTELTMEFPLLGETISTNAVVEEGMSDADVERRVRESATKLTEGMEGSMLSGSQKANLVEVQRRAREGPLRIHRMLASGSTDDLRSLREEPEVQAVGLKSVLDERVRRAREGR